MQTDKYKVIHTGKDARGGGYKLVRTPDGGCMYIWDKGHVWAGFKGSAIDKDVMHPTTIPLYRTTL